MGSLKKNFKIIPAALLSAGLRSKTGSSGEKKGINPSKRLTNLLFVVFLEKETESRGRKDAHLCRDADQT